MTVDDTSPPSSTTAGVMLLGATIAALAVANSPLAPTYGTVLHHKLGPLSVIHWINDGLMALFFLLIGLEIKREVLDGALATAASRLLPGAAAVAGMAVPALLYLGVTRGDATAMRGWAIPAATDIAFALAVLAALGSRIPPDLRVFLTAIAIVDDLGAIIVIGTFYTAHVDVVLLAAAAVGLAVLVAFNRAGVRRLVPYLLVGAGVWSAVQQSGVHATLAGVAVAFAIPLRGVDGPGPLHRLEQALTPIVAFAIVPLFGFANAGIGFDASTTAKLISSIPLGIIVALVVGKQTGVVGMVWLLTRLGLAPLPPGTSWRQIHGAALLCGIGFTMSLFIAALAFGEGSANDTMAKLGIMIASLLSAVAGYLALRTAS